MSSTEPLDAMVATRASDPQQAPMHDPIWSTAGDDFGSFVLLLESVLGVDLQLAEPTSLLQDDLGFDSLAMAELLVLFEDGGVLLPDELLPELRTLADLHHYFTLAKRHAEKDGER